MVEWDADYLPNAKLGLHSMQIVFGFVIFILEIILFRSENAVINANNGWTFGLCFLSIIPIIYLVMAPRWQRTRKIANPHAMLVVDCVFAILWLSAFASQAAYNTANSCGEGCKVSKAIVGMAFFEILFWAGTTFLSAYTLKYYQFNGNLPGYENIARKGGHQNIDPDKAAFSMAPHDEEAYAPINADDHDDHAASSSTPYNADSYGSRPMFDSETDYRAHSTAPSHDNPFGDPYRAHSVSPANDPYSSGYGAHPDAGGPRIYAPPSAEEYDDGRPAQFPTGNYDRTLH
ncbi:hypothetical protein BKA67DRAFT_351176 [Truncatella angustata]|uniref:MARVEL domain-containing protein n=1 Tax=Truncatella angustata TaxID=152316 RepID=A0A9P8ZWL9_9PEZI|nr:uncharacterized protein BKA67DRAFT_351176 [Truncatella angustata]KAH6652232.1 hypothetical protein BKA67DRAFT_351176 [Truncatella angustata]